MKYQLRPYQQEAVDIVNGLESGSYLLNLATGLGKTVIFTSFKRKGRVLVLVHREELAYQAKSKYDCPVGLEMAEHKSNGEEVIIASVQSLVRRLNKFSKDYFDMKILEYFNNRLTIGVTASPNRGDNVRLDDVFQKIIYQKDLRWAIENKYLTDIHCLRVNIGYDISKVSRRMGDFVPSELEQALNTDALNGAIAEAYKKYAKGATLIFATSVKHAQDIAKMIPGAVAVTADTKNRQKLINAFTNREIPCLVNCMIFTEGTDMPLVETIMIARPTQNSSLYTQMVGRGLRLYPGKDKLTLIDLVGVTGKANLCTAPSLLGIDLKNVSKSKQDEIEGDLFDLPDLINQKSDCVESWIRNIEIVDLWAKGQQYNLHNVNWFMMPNGDFTLNLKGKKLRIPAQNELGETILDRPMKMQEAFDFAYEYLLENYSDQKFLWDLSIVKKWGKSAATEKQKAQVKRFFKDYDVDNLTKLEASQILNRMFARR